MKKSKDKKIEIREIVYSQDEEKSFGDIFVYEPENIDERNLGNLFIIGELKDLPRNSSYVVNLLASKVKKEFYSNTKRSAEESLEAALSIANQTLSELADQGNGEYVGKLSMVCGTYMENKFFMSQVGKIRSLLVRDGQLLEIIKEEDGKHASPRRTFNNIASGELADGDFVLFATAGLFNIFSLEKLRQMAVSMDIDAFAGKLQEEIEEEDSEVVSALVFEISGKAKADRIDHTEVVLEDAAYEAEKDERIAEEPVALQEEEPIARRAEEETPAAGIVEEEKAREAELISENEIVAAEIETEVMPSPAKGTEAIVDVQEEVVPESAIETAVETTGMAGSGMTDKASEKISLSDIIKEYEKIENKRSESDVEKDRNIENIIGKKEDSDFQDLDERPEGNAIKNFAASVKYNIGSVNLQKFKVSPSSLLRSFGKLSKGGKGKEYKIKSVAGKTRLLTKRNAAIAALVVIVVAGGVYPRIAAEKEAKNRAAFYQSMLSESQTKLSAAENDSSSQNASRLFGEAKKLALQVKDEYDGLDGEADAVIGKAQSKLDEIDKVVRADGMETIAAFDNDVKKLVEVAGSHYAISGAGVVYKVDASTGTIKEVSKPQSGIGEIKSAQNFQDQEALFSDGSSFSSFNLKSGGVQTSAVKLDSAAQDFTAYGRFVYVLSPLDNQIYKYQKSGSELTGKTAWLKGGDVSGAVSMAIDQNIYVLYADGQVKKYYTGEEYVENGNKFSIVQPSEAITGATRLFTLADQKYLYILEASKGRVLIYDKANGLLLKQLVGDGFSGIEDISVDEKETALTLLMPGKIVKVNL